MDLALSLSKTSHVVLLAYQQDLWGQETEPSSRVSFSIHSLSLAKPSVAETSCPLPGSGGSSTVSTVMGIKVQTGHLTTFLSSKGLCPRPQPSSCCHCWIIISKERKFFSPLLVVQHKAGINTKHNILMPPLEHRWTSICLFLYRNLKSKNMWFQEEEGLLPGCLMVLHILSSQIGELFYRRGLGITCLRDFLLLYMGLLRRKGHYVVILASQVPCGVFLQSSPAK